MLRPTAWSLVSSSSAPRSGLPDDGRGRGPGVPYDLLEAATLLSGVYPRAIISTVPGVSRTMREVADTGPTLWLLLGVVAVLPPILQTYQG